MFISKFTQITPLAPLDISNRQNDEQAVYFSKTPFCYFLFLNTNFNELFIFLGDLSPYAISVSSIAFSGGRVTSTAQILTSAMLLLPPLS
jgi:hypothetical protein